MQLLPLKYLSLTGRCVVLLSLDCSRIDSFEHFSYPEKIKGALDQHSGINKKTLSLLITKRWLIDQLTRWIAHSRWRFDQEWWYFDIWQLVQISPTRKESSKISTHNSAPWSSGLFASTAWVSLDELHWGKKLDSGFPSRIGGGENIATRILDCPPEPGKGKSLFPQLCTHDPII